MSIKPFLLSFTATALLAAPFILEADAPPQLAEVRVAPGPGQDTMVHGIAFHSVLLKRDAKSATLRVTAQNPSATPIRTEVAAELMMMPQTSPMARMVPPPREVAAAPIAVSLAPGQKIIQTITVKLPADVAKQLAAADKAAAKAKELPKNNAEVAIAMETPPRLYTMVREPAPPAKSTKQAQAQGEPAEAQGEPAQAQAKPQQLSAN